MGLIRQGAGHFYFNDSGTLVATMMCFAHHGCKN
jgi:hypothetical protein